MGVQYTDQRSVGDAQIGSFTTWNLGLGARLSWRGLSLGAAGHFTGDGNNIQSPYGTWPGYLSLIQTDFDHAGEKAWGVGLTYDFGGTLLPFQAPGFLARLAYARGTGIVDPSTGASQAGRVGGGPRPHLERGRRQRPAVPVPQRLLGQRGNRRPDTSSG